MRPGTPDALAKATRELVLASGAVVLEAMEKSADGSLEPGTPVHRLGKAIEGFTAVLKTEQRPGELLV